MICFVYADNNSAFTREVIICPKKKRPLLSLSVDVSRISFPSMDDAVLYSTISKVSSSASIANSLTSSPVT